ncbi:MAG: hypothetical protein HeimC3_00670 [Candidatus Heimdallarchaeota archaeon LC_3]|nr:MAG: hypothetical protein HeimC3_00670 [Candidatus Heimdallarchaeota archaeon LC_3]
MINFENKSVKMIIRENKYKLLLTAILLILVVIYFYQINWTIFFSYVSELRMEFFYLSSFFALFAFTTDGIIWYYFLKPLAPSEINFKDILGLNYFSTMAGVIIPSAGAVDIAIKLKYVKNNTSLSYEKIFATILAVRTIFIIALYPTMALFVYVLVAFELVTLEIAFGVIFISFFILSIILGLIIMMTWKVDFFNNKFIPLIFFPINRFERTQNLKIRIKNSSYSFSQSFQLLKGSKKYTHLLLLFIGLFWIARFLAMYYIFLVLQDFPFHIIVLASTLGSFTTMIPAFIPGMAGVRDIVQTEILKLVESQIEISLFTSLMNQVQTFALFILSLGIFLLIRKKIRKQPVIDDFENNLEK